MRDYWVYDSNCQGTGSSQLNADESHHLVRVLRFQTGDEVAGTNGKGLEMKGYVQAADAKRAVLEWTEVIEHEKKRSTITLAVAPTKSIDRFEWFLEKATELGIDRIIPIWTKNSERKKLRIDRSYKVILAAVKQSKQVFVPELKEPMTFEELINWDANGDRFIAHCHDGEKPLLFDSIHAGNDVCVGIGPEGDFDSDEVQKAIQNGWKAISLGENRLRTETAGIVACHMAVLKMN
jgi:16S rRNA (uracil1498-N3)-methyltransferase